MKHKHVFKPKNHVFKPKRKRAFKCSRCGKKIRDERLPEMDISRDICDSCFLKDLDQHIDERLQEAEKI